MMDHTRAKRHEHWKDSLGWLAVFVAGLAITAAVLAGAPGSWFALVLICVAAFAGGWCATALRQTRNTLEMRSLHNHMTAFLRSQDGVAERTTGRVKQGIGPLYDAFDQVATIVAADTARELQSSEDRTVLVREVHHRVKNNLQLVSSIMSMHMRATDDEEVVDTLARIQDRVASLATVHSDLYQGSEGGIIPMAPLLNEIVDSAADLGQGMDSPLRIEREIADVGLQPDQAVPLSLLTAETLHTILRNVSRGNGKADKILVSLEQAEDCILRIEVSGLKEQEPIAARSVGEQLLQAHATQLGAKSNDYWQDDVYHFDFSFTPADLKTIS